MKIQNRTLHISDEEGKMWKVREFFYPVEAKDLIVIYINVNKSNNYYIEENHLCLKEKLFLHSWGQECGEVIKNSSIKLDENETTAL